MLMKLTSEDGSLFEMDIAGYQFPEDVESPLPELDLNWLRVRVHARDSGNRGWEATDSCLLASELADLAEWLEKHSRGDPEIDSIQFMEPCLWFEADQCATEDLLPDAGNLLCVVHLGCELGLPLETLHGKVRLESLLRFRVTPEEMLQAAGSCREMAGAFPIRNRIYEPLESP